MNILNLRHTCAESGCQTTMGECPYYGDTDEDGICGAEDNCLDDWNPAKKTKTETAMVMMRHRAHHKDSTKACMALRPEAATL